MQRDLSAISFPAEICPQERRCAFMSSAAASSSFWVSRVDPEGSRRVRHALPFRRLRKLLVLQVRLQPTVHGLRLRVAARRQAHQESAVNIEQHLVELLLVLPEQGVACHLHETDSHS